MTHFETFLMYATLGLAALSMVLHVVAPKTKNTYDDKVLEIVDEIIPLMPKSEDKK